MGMLVTILEYARTSLKIIKENPAIAKKVEGGGDLWGNTTPLGVAAGQGDKEIDVTVTVTQGGQSENLSAVAFINGYCGQQLC